jgi:hypothetical protein
MSNPTIDSISVDRLFSRKVYELARAARYSNKKNYSDETLNSIISAEKAEMMISYLASAKEDESMWEMRVSIIWLELLNKGIVDDQSATEYINKLPR